MHIRTNAVLGKTFSIAYNYPTLTPNDLDLYSLLSQADGIERGILFWRCPSIRLPVRLSVCPSDRSSFPRYFSTTTERISMKLYGKLQYQEEMRILSGLPCPTFKSRVIDPE